MIIDKELARNLIKNGHVSYLGNVWNNGELYGVVTNHQEYRTDHFGPLTTEDPEFNGANTPDTIITL